MSWTKRRGHHPAFSLDFWQRSSYNKNVIGALSSAGEHLLDAEGARGSIPLVRTRVLKRSLGLRFSLCIGPMGGTYNNN
ncbi:MAG: hypothetical protein PWR31_327 [Bacillota bacterium]|nr:hypothetical protein [Bacillota bacterium]